MNPKEVSAKFHGRPGADPAAIQAFQQATGLVLPDDCVEFLRMFDGGEGFVGSQYLVLWGINELQQFNADYEVERYLPGYLLIGSDGGGEAYGFKLNSNSWKVVRVPFIGMERESVKELGSSFSEFLTSLRQQ